MPSRRRGSLVLGGRRPSRTKPRARELYNAELRAIAARTDRFLAVAMACQWAVASSILLLHRASSSGLDGVAASLPAAALGLLIVGPPIALGLTRPGRPSSRLAIAVGQMALSGLLIHLTNGRIETHFHVFGSLALLAAYRDGRVLLVATAVTALDHMTRGLLWPMSIYGVATAAPWRWLEHSGWVLFEDIFLVWFCRMGRREILAVSMRRAMMEKVRANVERTVAERTAELSERARELEALAIRLADTSVRARAVLDAATEIAIISSDSQGTVAVFNVGAERMLGYGAEEVVGRATPELWHVREEMEARGAELSVAFGRPVRGIEVFMAPSEAGDRGEREWTFIRKDGGRLSVRLVVTPIRDSRGDISGYLGIARDVTDRKRAEAELLRAKLAAEAASRAKSEFLANVSHEIRTPMNGIIGMTQLALQTSLDREQREYLEMVRSSADALLVVINDILDFSKIEAGRLQLDPIDFNLRDAVGEVLKILGLRAHDRGLELTCEIPPDVPDALVGDPGRLRQILVNLIGNAIKFTHQGEVAARVELRGRDEAGVLLQFSVRDTGIGIAPENQEAIWAPFQQADGSTSRHYGGTGLGLSISNRLAGLMDGETWLESAPGAGSTFHFTARFGVGEEHAPAEPGGLGPDIEGVDVLIVDDNETNRRILRETAAGWGLRPVAVDSGKAALEALEDGRTPFRIVLTDLMMPEMDGFELARRIRAIPRLADLPIIMLSSAGRIDPDLRRSLRLGSYLIKPVKPSELREAITQALLRPPEPDPAPIPPPAPDPCATPTPREVEAEAGRPRLLLAEDNRVNQVLATRLLEKAGYAIRVVGDGRLALDLLEADPFAFDLVLMDIQMPNLGGMEAVDLIRRDPALRCLKVVAMTAHALKGDQETCLAAGFDGYISKPLDTAKLLREIERHLPRPAARAV